MQLGFDKAGRLHGADAVMHSYRWQSVRYAGALQSGDMGRAEIIVVLLFKK